MEWVISENAGQDGLVCIVIENGNSHGRQFSNAGVDKTKADSGDNVIPKETSSTTIN